MHPDVREIVFTEDEIQDRIKELGRQITEDYAGESVVLVAILKGAVMFLADLARAVDLPVELDFMVVSSYGLETKSSGVVRIVKDLEKGIEGRHVIIAEDILDSGLTLKYLLRNLASRNPASLEVCCLLKKDKGQNIRSRYIGFDCPDEFVVGYGLDYGEYYRNLPYVGVLKPEVYE